MTKSLQAIHIRIENELSFQDSRASEISAQANAIAETEMANFIQEKEIPGIAFGLVFDGELVFSSGLGETKAGSGTAPAVDSVFRIASMTKSFTAQAALLLRDRGLLDLHAPIQSYLPWVQTIGLPPESPEITTWDLLTMGAGFPTDDPWGDRQEDLPLRDFDELVHSGLTFNRSVNTAFEYSNLGYALLGRLIAVAAGEKYEDFVEREVIAKAGMTSTTFFTEKVQDETRSHGHVKFPSGLQLVPPVKTGAFTPMGGLHSSVQDLAKWVARFQSGAPEAQRPARLARAYLSASEGEIPDRVITSQYGFGLFVDDDAELGRFISHSGGYPGFGSHMRWHRETKWGIIGLGNLTYAPMSIICAKILNQIVWLHAQGRKPIQRPLQATIVAMDEVESLLRQWNDELANQRFAMNMDLDCPRADRIAEFSVARVALGDFAREPDSLSTAAPSHAKWRVAGGGKKYEIEVLLSPEKVQKIQKIALKEITENEGVPTK